MLVRCLVRPQIQIAAEIERWFRASLGRRRPNFFQRAVAAAMRRFRNFAALCLEPSRFTRKRASITEAIQRVFFTRTFNAAHQIGTVFVGAECNQIAGTALRTFHALANAK